MFESAFYNLAYDYRYAVSRNLEAPYDKESVHSTLKMMVGNVETAFQRNEDEGEHLFTLTSQFMQKALEQLPNHNIASDALLNDFAVVETDLIKKMDSLNQIKNSFKPVL
jgi:hypothetical protein